MAILLSVLFLVSLTAVATSATHPSQGQIPYQGTKWVLSSLDGKSVLKGTTITLTFGKESVTGSAGCNFYSGKYKTDSPSSLTIQSIGVTRMFCGKPAGIMQQEREYINLLKNVKKYTVNKNYLFLKTSDGRILVFNKMSHAIKTRWALNSLNDKSILKDTSITLTLDDESVTGSAGCNFYSGKYKANDAGSLTIQSIISTLKLCGKPAGIMQQEREYLNLLQNVKEYTITKNNLILKTNDGRELVFNKMVL
jgi:heat shock protein HslJ